MRGNLTIDKASMNLSYFLYSIRIIANNGGKIGRRAFGEKMGDLIGVPSMKGGKENRTPYNKSKLPRYFGFIDVESGGEENYLVLTIRGEKLNNYIEENSTKEPNERFYISRKHRNDFVDLLFESVVFDTFGKNNCGAEQSNTDVEPPRVVFKTIYELNGATSEEICYVMFGLNNGEFTSFDEAIEEIQKNRKRSRYDYSEIMEAWGITNIVHDFKLVNIFTDPNIQLLTSDRNEEIDRVFYYLSPTLSSKHLEQIKTLSVTYSPLRLCVYADYDATFSLKEWVEELVLGRVSNKDNIISVRQGDTLCGAAGEGGYNPGLFDIAIRQALLNPKDNIYLVFEDMDDVDIVNMFGDKSYALKTVYDLEDEHNGWSIDAIDDLDLFDYLLNYDRGIKRVIERDGLRVPSNIHIIGVKKMAANEKEKNYDYEFTRIKVKEEEREYIAKADKPLVDINYISGLKSAFSRNRIAFGAPGTGKSYSIDEDRKKLLVGDATRHYERVTFHPDYSYAHFVGTYKPVSEKGEISYQFVPGPFIRTLVDALKNAQTDSPMPYLLIIEEINRANVASVFGDVFQLLDRDENNISQYPIETSEDLRRYLSQEFECAEESFEKIYIPDNMFIWASMNSADQGVFPMDTAFKRRWDFHYLGIDDKDELIRNKTVVLGSKVKQRVEWNKLRKAINKFLAAKGINEDKQLGPYFISKRIVVPESGNEIDSRAFIETFKNKVLMYLFEDAARQKRPSLFEGCFENSNRYSEICREFEEKGIGIFHHDIQLNAEPEDLTGPETSENE